MSDAPPQARGASGCNPAFVSHAAGPARSGDCDGAAGQSAYLIGGWPETAGLDHAPVWP
ncbi:MAG: hypothetical protein Q4G14_04540 [Paracoccus sp. (in: a-proteobacteria)]|uniref:hypothetical protein n=1 Tax=Paracoccus sp. TaxID=267 RepID=UPI0026DF3FD8|nr:hypothetical protein [Paracoccus sp. (in: a-proteobacteria)]MDO5612497.1 hypothetical protein [Paracoccus sp. (in: a-proteobacteria)]